MPELISYFNGEFVPDSQCMVHIFDRGFRYGDAVFDIQRTFNGKPFRIKEHLERFMRSLKYARLEPGFTIDRWEELTLDVAQRNEPYRHPGGDLFIGQYVSRGRSNHVLEDVPLTICIRAWHLEPDQWVSGYQKGIHGVFVKTQSYSPMAVDSKVKHNNRLNFSLAQLEATDVDPDASPLLQDGRGNITEGIQANFFVVQNGVLKMPQDSSSLQGDAGRLIRDIAGNLGIPIVAEDLQPYDAYTADEAFLSNTAFCIMPVGLIDNRPIGSDVPGPITRQLQAAWSEIVGLDFVDQALNYAPPS